MFFKPGIQITTTELEPRPRSKSDSEVWQDRVIAINPFSRHADVGGRFVDVQDVIEIAILRLDRNRCGQACQGDRVHFGNLTDECRQLGCRDRSDRIEHGLQFPSHFNPSAFDVHRTVYLEHSHPSKPLNPHSLVMRTV